MSTPSDLRGAAPVGTLDALPPAEAAAVRWLRLWCEGPDGWAAMQAEMQAMLGVPRAAALAGAFDLTCRLTLEFRRRPLMRHAAACPCLGADEATFAHFLTLAGLGERDEAMLVAILLVRADMAPLLVDTAARAGLEIHRAVLVAADSRLQGRVH
ncbi:MAG: hypothetical protein JNK88_03380 [Mangrovicoccus sp.]|nr:hypothetical protein [Mangrovicoccus sp.]